MSEATKAAVLAKCQDVAPSAGHQSPLDANKTSVLRVNDRQIGDRSNDFQIDCWKDGAVLSLTISDETHSDSYVWAIAAEILQIIPAVDEFEAATTARQYAHDLEQARKEGYEAARAENRPSDALLASAFLCGAQCGFDDSRYSSVRECPAFGLFLSTLPPDTLQADRELVAKYLPCLDLIDATARGKAEDCVDEADKLEAALKRVLGLEVGNGL